MDTVKLKLMLVLRDLGNRFSGYSRFRLPQAALRRAFRHIHGTVRITDFDTDLSIKLRLSEYMQRRIFWMGYYNMEIIPFLKRHLKAGMTVLDIGANIGEISMVAAKCVGNTGRVYAFEPIDAIADQLQDNISRNDLRQVSIVRMGLSDAVKDDVPIYAACNQANVHDEHSGLGSLYGAASGKPPLQHIAITTLDEWLQMNPVERIDLIKIDIEGAELPCLKGAERALRKFRPMLIVEVQEPTANIAGYRAHDILEFLSRHDYAPYRLRRDGSSVPFGAATVVGVQNLFFKP